MHPNVQRSERRRHSAEFKAKVLAQCQEHGASVASVALSNGLNANLVRKWLVGRGLGRASPLPTGVESNTAQQVMLPAQATSASPAARPLQFVPVELPSPSPANDATADGAGAAPADAACIHVELRRGDTSLAVRWPLSQAQGCTAWLGELSGAVLAAKGRS